MMTHSEIKIDILIYHNCYEDDTRSIINKSIKHIKMLFMAVFLEIPTKNFIIYGLGVKWGAICFRHF